MRRVLIAFLLISTVGIAEGAGRRRAVRHPGGPIAPPAAVADSYSVDAGGTLTMTAPGVLANDTLNGATLVSFGPSAGTEQTALGSTAQTAQGGSLTLAADGGFTYTPTSGFAGSDTFKYVIRNGGGSAPGTVTITVNAAQLAASNDAYTTRQESALFVPAPGVLANDTLAGGRIASFGNRGTEQTVLGTTSPTSQGGTISLREDGGFLYTPPPSADDGYGNVRPFVGLDSFNYVIRSGAASSTAGVSVVVDSGETAEADFVVTTPGHFYSFEGFAGQNPVVQLKRGQTYTFELKAASIHPFEILGAPAGSVTNNDITRGIITFAVPMAAQNYSYHCTTHDFGNVIETVP